MKTIAFFLATLVPAIASAQEKPTTGYAPVNGLKMYYEVHGTGEPVVLFRAWKPLTMPRDERGDVPVSMSRRLLEEEEALLKAVAEARTRHPEIEIEGEFIAERAGQAMVDASNTAVLVVVGSRGHGALTETVLGSVSLQVLHHAHCPVAVVR